MKKWLFNPFIYVAGSRALITGLVLMVITAIIAFVSHTHFDGVIDVHTSRNPAPLAVSFMEQIVNLACVIILFYAAGLLFSKSSVRLVDIAGTLSLARWPMIFVAIIGFGLIAPASDSLKVVMESITPLHILLSIVSLLLSIWMIALMYNAFTVSANIKGGKALIVFIACLLIAEISAHIILHQIYRHTI